MEDSDSKRWEPASESRKVVRIPLVIFQAPINENIFPSFECAESDQLMRGEVTSNGGGAEFTSTRYPTSF
jgi:hypothetical protein